MLVRLTSGEQTGRVVELEDEVARELLDSGKAQEVGAPFVAAVSVDSPDASVRDTNSTGPVEFAAMDSVNADGTVTGVVEEPKPEKPEKPAKAKRKNHGRDVSAVARDRDGDGELSHGERVSAAARNKPETPETSVDAKRGKRAADDEEVKEERTDEALAAERDAR
jgi:hypothetical protein